MRTTVTIDDKLYQDAVELLDPNMDRADIFREAMKAFVQRQSARRLMAMGGAIPDMVEVPRRAPESVEE